MDTPHTSGSQVVSRMLSFLRSTALACHYRELKAILLAAFLCALPLSANADVTVSEVATGLSNPTALAVDGDYVYFGQLTNSTGTLNRVPKIGGNVEQFLTGTALFDSGSYRGIDRLAFSATDVFLGFGGYVNYQIGRTPKGGGAYSGLLAPDGAPLLGLIGSDLYYAWGFCCIEKVANYGIGPSTTVLNGVWVRSFVVDGTSIYFVDLNTKNVYAFDTVAAVLTQLITGNAVEGAIVVDANNLYFSQGTSINVVQKGGGTVSTLYTGNNVAVFASDDSKVFFVENGDIKAISVDGGPPVALVSGVSISAAAIDGPFLYWADTGATIGQQAIYRLDVQALNSPSLVFPLVGFNADDAPINSVFDHSMRSQQSSNLANSTIAPYTCDGRVIAYTGEIGLSKGWPKTVPSCKNQPGYPKPTTSGKPSLLNNFFVNGNYTGAGTPDLLNYDGHDGVDYRAALQTHALAALSGTVQYPLDIVGARNNRAYNTFHTLAIVPDGFPNYRLYYLHVSSHPLDFPSGQALTVSDPTPSCPATVTFPIPAGTHVSAGCLVALTGQAGTCDKKNNCAPHLHFEIQRRIPLADLGFARARVETSMTCPDDAQMACIPIDPYGWTGAPTDCSEIGTLDSDPASPSSDIALGDYYECDTGIPSVRLWK